MNKKNEKLYKILGVDVNSSSQAIRLAYRKLAKKLHPDKGGEQEKFQELQEAYDILSDPKKKEIYDNYGEEGLKNGNNESYSFDPFETLFKRRRSNQDQPIKCKSHKVQMKITLTDVFNGVKKILEYTKRKVCPYCLGSGANNSCAKFICPKYKGKGVEFIIERLANILFQREQKCRECCGEGELIKEKCSFCKGEKVLFERKEIEVDIKKGVLDGYCFVFEEHGDEYPGFVKGDLLVEISIEKHKMFVRQNANLILDVKISFVEALTGIKLQIHHLNGKKIMIKSKQGEIIKPGHRKFIKNLGLPLFDNPYLKGDLIIRFEILLPEKLNQQQRENLNKIFNNDRKNLNEEEVYKCTEKYFLSDYVPEERSDHYSEFRNFFDIHSEREGNNQFGCSNQ